MIWVGFAPEPRTRGIGGYIKKAITQLVMRGFDLLICHSGPLVQSVCQTYHHVSSRVRYVRWGEDMSWLEKASDNAADNGYIFSGGRTNRDFSTVLAAVRELKVTTKLAVGAEYTLKEDIPEHVEIYRDVSWERFEELLRESTVVVITLAEPEISSGQTVLLQAMLCRKAIIITNTAGIDDYVTNGKNVIFVKPRDPSDLRDKLRFLLADSDLRIQLGEPRILLQKRLTMVISLLKN